MNTMREASDLHHQADRLRAAPRRRHIPSLAELALHQWYGARRRAGAGGRRLPRARASRPTRSVRVRCGGGVCVRRLSLYVERARDVDACCL